MKEQKLNRINTAALYVRCSPSSQREEINAQLSAMNDYCQRNGVTVVREYIDISKTAKIEDRPNFQRMINDSASGEFDGVVVHKLDRFTRDRYEFVVYRRKLRMNGVSVSSVLGNIDGSPESVLLEALVDGMAEYYSKNLDLL